MSADKPDQSFDGIASKFDKNIYGTSKGRLREAVLAHQLSPYLTDCSPLSIIDIGGGTGAMAKLALVHEHKVHVNDISADAITLAQEKLAAYGERVEFTCQDLQSLNLPQFDAVFCHAVLEWTQHPLQIIDKLLTLLRNDGFLSLTFFNYDASLFGNALYGNFDLIRRGLITKNRVRLNPNNPQRPKVIMNYLLQQGLSIELSAGIRCFHDYMRDRQQQITHYDDLLALELEYSTQEPYKWLGKYFHIIARKAGA
ncbi:methyltransferase [Alteromonas flava]|uniref:methyltransferase n=1 Tax=Alteromonas flava TaxID=2048003 RepID=UPI000C2873F9|nr:methyltransferase [Alteromonas flava]